jgi:O-antigen ligase
MMLHPDSSMPKQALSLLWLCMGLAAITAFGVINGVVAVGLAPDMGLSVLLPVGLIVLAGGASVVTGALLGRSWGYLIFIALIAVGFSISFRMREAGDAGLDLQNGAKFAGWMVALAIGVLHLPKIAPLIRQPHIAGILMFCVMAIISSAYSPVSPFSFANSVGLLSFFLLGLVGVTLTSAHSIVTTYTVALAAYMALNLAISVVAPVYAYLPPSESETVFRLRGLAGHPNVLGQQAVAFLALVFVCFDRGWLKRWGLVLVMAGMGLAVLWMTNSRTNLGVIGVSIGLVLLRRRPALLISAMVLAVAGVLALIVMPSSFLDFVVGSFSRTGSAAEILTLTGRTELWQFCLGKIAEQPLFGYGFMAAEHIITHEYVSPSYGSTLNAHNTLLQCLISVGIVGAAPLLYSIGWMLWAFARRPDSLRDIFMLLLLLSGLTEVVIFGATPGLYAQVFFAAVAVSAAKPLGLGGFSPTDDEGKPDLARS